MSQHAHNGVTAGARYVAIITDGNGRWAHARGLSIGQGHDAGADTLKARLSDALDFGVQQLSVYTFSTENWSRPPAEVRALMDMFTRRIAIEAPGLHEQGIRMRFTGRRHELPADLQDQMNHAEALTAPNQRMALFMGFSYGGRAEILDACRRFEGTTEEEFRHCLYAPDMHDPDLIIRTGGEQRLSNYLMWQSAYAELMFCQEMWPDFSREAFERCLAEFSARTRRFGGRSRHAPTPVSATGPHQPHVPGVTAPVNNRSTTWSLTQA